MQDRPRVQAFWACASGIANKVGARPPTPSAGFDTALDGLSAEAIRESAERSVSRLGVGRLDLMYAHVEDPAVPLSETVEGFAELVSDGAVGLLTFARPAALGPQAWDSHLGLFRTSYPARSSTADTPPLERTAIRRAPAAVDKPVRQRTRLTCYSGRASTLSWPVGPTGDPVGSLPDLTSSSLTGPCGTLCDWGVLGELTTNVFRGGAASRADTLRPSRGRHVIFAVHNYVRAPVAQPDRAAAF